MNKELKILAIFPHPDDSVIFAGASLTKWVQEGHKVSAVCCTDGEVGTLRMDLTKEDVANSRKKELLAANEIIGIEKLEMLHHPDAGLMDAKKLRKDLIRCVRKYRPDRVITMDPWAKYEIHPDHKTVGRMGAEAAAFAGFPLLYPEQLNEEIQPHTASEVWFMGLLGHKPNYFVDVSFSVGKKVEAMLQFETTFSIIADLVGLEIDPDDLLDANKRQLIKGADEWLRAKAARVGENVGLEAAEAFYVQKCLPGHFDNLRQATDEMLGHDGDVPMIC